MATAEVDKIETEWHQVKKEITCCMCRKFFTDPRTLSCSHTFCKKCIENKLEEASRNEPLDEAEDEDHEYVNTAALCPLCLAPLPQDDASSARVDLATSCLIEIYKRKEGKRLNLVKVTCGKCNDGAQQVTTWCLICHCALCTSCSSVHSKQRRYESHATVFIAEFVQIRREACRTHPYQMLDLYCKTCTQLACKECIAEDHLKHEFDLINKEMKGGEKIIARLREMAERTQKRYTKAIKIPKKTQTLKDNPPLYVGMYDFLAADYNEMSFSKGDLLYIISDNGDWWFAKSKTTGQEGYIPKTYIVECKPLDDEE